MLCPSREARPSESARAVPVMWAPDGKFLYLLCAETVTHRSWQNAGHSVTSQARCCPSCRLQECRARMTPISFPGSYLIDAYGISPSPDPSVYAYVKTTMHRNLFSIPLR